MNGVFSHSRLGCYENCPRQFRYRYIERLPAPTQGIEAFVGKRVHEILERLYRFVDAGRLPALGAVLERFAALWDEHFDPEQVRIARSGTPAGAYRALGERCLRNFYRNNYPFDDGETLGLEQHVRFSLDAEGAYPMQGIIDRLARARDGRLEIHDYKTGRRLPSQRALDEDRQLALYELGVRERYGERGEIRLVWHYLQHGEVRSSSRTAEQLDALRSQTMELIDRIQDESQYEPRPGPLCAWCEYNEICPAGGGKAEPSREAPASRLEGDPPARPSAACDSSGQLSLL